LAAGVLALTLAASTYLAVAPEALAETPAGQITWALHFTLAPTLFEPAETPGLITPFIVLYALHDAMLKPMPGKHMAPSLAESWTMSPDGLVYEFVLRKNVRFHNGEPVTAEDVKFSFERYRGISAKVLKDKVAAVETPDASRVRFRLRQPWPDFMTFYGTLATGAGWVVPKKYVERVGEDGFRKAPVGAGPYRFVSFTPGIELVLEAFEGYWRKSPSAKRLVLRTIPDPSTRLARRGGHRLLDDRRAGRRDPAHTRAQPEGRLSVDALALLPRAVGPEVAVARPPRAARREPRDRPEGH